MKAADGRPIYFNLIKIYLPVTGVVSIAHRISGILMFLAIPYLAYIFELSLQSQDGFNEVVNQLSSLWLRPIIFLMFWSIAHHLLAGIRFLLIDLGIFVNRNSAHISAYVALLSGILLLILFITMAAF